MSGDGQVFAGTPLCGAGLIWPDDPAAHAARGAAGMPGQGGPVLQPGCAPPPRYLGRGRRAACRGHRTCPGLRPRPPGAGLRAYRAPAHLRHQAMCWFTHHHPDVSSRPPAPVLPGQNSCRTSGAIFRSASARAPVGPIRKGALWPLFPCRSVIRRLTRHRRDHGHTS